MSGTRRCLSHRPRPSPLAAVGGRERLASSHSTSEPPNSKRPASQFYWDDWLRDSKLRRCSLAARGLWMDMLAFMHDGAPYGHLRVTAEGLARMVGDKVPLVRKLLAELDAAGVPSKTDDGTWFSRRMVRDEELRLRRSAGGSKSLDHPNVPRPKEKDTDKDGSKDTVEGYPSERPSGSPSDHPLPRVRAGTRVEDEDGDTEEKEIGKEEKKKGAALVPLHRQEQIRLGEHRAHAMCFFGVGHCGVCLPAALYRRFVETCGIAERIAAEKTVEQWAETVDRAWVGMGIGDNDFKFWEWRWSERLGSTKPSTAAQNLDAMREATERFVNREH